MKLKILLELKLMIIMIFVNKTQNLNLEVLDINGNVIGKSSELRVFIHSKLINFSILEEDYLIIYITDEVDISNLSYNAIYRIDFLYKKYEITNTNIMTI